LATTMPADSWPRTWVSSTIMGPMAPCFQKWTSELERC
jgi:hypothetical protein